MRITFLTPVDQLNGGTRVVATYAKLLQARGHDVLVVSRAPAKLTWRQRWRALKHGHWQAQRQEVRASRLPGHLAQSGVPHLVLAADQPIQDTDLPDADVLVATWWETAVWMHAMPASKGRPVHLIQGYEVWWGGEAARRQVHDALRLPNRKIAISLGLKRDIEAQLGDLGMAVVANAVDHRQFDAPPRGRGTPPTVGLMYSADAIKGTDRAVAAIELARRHLPELRVLAFGAQPPSAACPLPTGTEFHLCPPQSSLAGLYAQCDAWLFTSRVDSFGLPILEAMACRTPVLGVAVGAAPSLLTQGGGILVETPSEAELPSAIAASLVTLLNGPEQAWQAMSDRAHAQAHAYTWEDATARLETLLSEAPPHRLAVAADKFEGDEPMGRRSRWQTLPTGDGAMSRRQVLGAALVAAAVASPLRWHGPGGQDTPDAAWSVHDDAFVVVDGWVLPAQYFQD